MHILFYFLMPVQRHAAKLGHMAPDVPHQGSVEGQHLKREWQNFCFLLFPEWFLMLICFFDCDKCVFGELTTVTSQSSPAQQSPCITECIFLNCPYHPLTILFFLHVPIASCSKTIWMMKVITSKINNKRKKMDCRTNFTNSMCARKSKTLFQAN